jgi:hypothetical protein
MKSVRRNETIDMHRMRGQNNTIIIFKMRWRGGRDLIFNNERGQ